MTFNPDTCVQEGPTLDVNLHTGTVRDLAFCSDTILASGGTNTMVKLTDVSTGQSVGQLVTGSDDHQVLSLAPLQGQGLLWSASSDSTVRLWDYRLRRAVTQLRLPVDMTTGASLQGVALSVLDHLLVVGCEDGHCLTMDARQRQWLQQISAHSQDCRSVHASRQHAAVLSGSFDGTVAWTPFQGSNSANPNELGSSTIVARHSKKVIQVRWHPTMPLFASTSTDHSVRLWQQQF